MGRLIRVLIACVLGVTLLAVSPGPASAQLTPPLYNIYGYTTDAIGRALAAVTVRDRSASDATDVDGRFDLPQRELGSIPLTASRWDLDSRTEYVTVNVPVDTRHDFNGLLYRVSISLDKTYLSTASGAASFTANVSSWAPSPGLPGQMGLSCVTVTDSRTATTTHASLAGQNPDGSYSWRLQISLPQGTSEGSYSVSARAVACDSGVVLTRQVASSYLVDNIPPKIYDFVPGDGTNTIFRSQPLLMRIFDGGGSGVSMGSISFTLFDVTTGQGSSSHPAIGLNRTTGWAKSAPIALTQGHLYRFTAAAKDLAGNSVEVSSAEEGNGFLVIEMQGVSTQGSIPSTRCEIQDDPDSLFNQAICSNVSLNYDPSMVLVSGSRHSFDLGYAGLAHRGPGLGHGRRHHGNPDYRRSGRPLPRDSGRQPRTPLARSCAECKALLLIEAHGVGANPRPAGLRLADIRQLLEIKVVFPVTRG